MEITDRNYRSAIYPKDVANITGKSVKSASRLVAKIKKELGKDRHHILTISEFCQYMGFKIKDIMGSMNL
jgi:hypothetical protein